MVVAVFCNIISVVEMRKKQIASRTNVIDMGSYQTDEIGDLFNVDSKN